MRARAKQGSIVLDKRSKTWDFFYWQDRKRHSKTIGTLKNLPTKAAAWRAAKALREAVEQQTTMDTRSSVPTVGLLITQYQAENANGAADSVNGRRVGR